MSDQPIPLNDDELDTVSGGVGAPSKDASATLQDLVQTSGTDIYAVMAQFQQMAQEQRNAAREQRDAGMQGQIDALKTTAEEIRQAAAERMTAAMTQGAATIASGMAGIGSGIAAAGMMGGGKFDALETDAKKAELDAQEAVQKQGVQNANDLMDQMQSIIKDTRDKLNSIDESRTETNRGIARNI